MCSGNAQNNARAEAEREYWRQQDALNAEAKRRQAELDRIAADRQSAAAAQQAQIAAMQQQMQQQVAAQQAAARAAEERKAQGFAQAQAEQQQKLTQMRAEQEQRMGGIRATGSALRSSMQILSQQGGKQAPTAQLDRKKNKAVGARSTSAALRMGSTGSGSGSGANLSV